MARSFHVGVVNLNIGMTAYLLTLVGRVVILIINGHSALPPQLTDFRLAIPLMALLALGPLIDSVGPPAFPNTRSLKNVTGKITRLKLGALHLHRMDAVSREGD